MGKVAQLVGQKHLRSTRTVLGQLKHFLESAHVTISDIALCPYQLSPRPAHCWLPIAEQSSVVSCGSAPL